MDEPLLIVGASHQGEVVLDILRSQPDPPLVAGFIDAGPKGRFVGRSIGGVPVLDTITNLASFAGLVLAAVPAVGDAFERQELATTIEAAGLILAGAVHTAAYVSPDVEFGPGTVIAAGALVMVGTRIGRGCIVNTGAIVDHHCVVDDFSHVAPGACLTGGVVIGRRAWVGARAVIREDLIVGEDAVVGAGSVVIRDVPQGITVVGVPARPRTAVGGVQRP